MPASGETDKATEKELQRLRRLPENKVCPNCLKEDRLGFTAVCMEFKTFVCGECKSAHQSFSHRCKSTAMSIWSMEEVKVLDGKRNGGNMAARATYLARVPDNERPTQDSALEAYKRFVERAYIEKRWMGDSGGGIEGTGDMVTARSEESTRPRERHREKKAKREKKSRKSSSVSAATSPEEPSPLSNIDQPVKNSWHLVDWPGAFVGNNVGVPPYAGGDAALDMVGMQSDASASVRSAQCMAAPSQIAPEAVRPPRFEHHANPWTMGLAPNAAGMAYGMEDQGGFRATTSTSSSAASPYAASHCSEHAMPQSGPHAPPRNGGENFQNGYFGYMEPPRGIPERRIGITGPALDASMSSNKPVLDFRTNPWARDLDPNDPWVVSARSRISFPLVAGNIATTNPWAADLLGSEAHQGCVATA
mmetsp:Transcript_102628/g.290031  ORF Transcript_102628/g.290031 Transcript_102628/m.290031 type:complete len:420 (-) Transcript_102628:207-1466(-)|eukprot:CAMPEP_0117515958 /NCGR_PEP_ID=MMETSP0784-20121206/30847_1 /TAXON_ID=39447 /ORGANISM="" /LENGTH=419 /DNA_ID=CAMNT_0005311789 /DNA_START=36 /DNA_END=1295 /DNA_ORIENTATION=-